jgi:hypothetical protein
VEVERDGTSLANGDLLVVVLVIVLHFCLRQGFDIFMATR